MGALLIQWLTTPVLMSLLCEDSWWAGILAFVTTFFMWSINYVAQEIEEPFGGDANDLPLIEMQTSFNDSLATLLMKKAQAPPMFSFDKAEHRILRLSHLNADYIGHHFSETSSCNSDRSLPVLRRQET